uniref:Uncharacterized protein n=1 Tax=Anguilla anguilla TaxID=7936 RepID=A0A0E9WXX5_ANGAN
MDSVRMLREVLALDYLHSVCDGEFNNANTLSLLSLPGYTLMLSVLSSFRTAEINLHVYSFHTSFLKVHK